MKINPEQILTNFEKLKFPSKIFLISGNEETFIKKIQQHLILKLNSKTQQIKKCFNAVVDKDSIIESGDLFVSNFKVVTYNNPVDINLLYLESIKPNDLTIIIAHTTLKVSSKFKKYFDTHKKFVSISCYKLAREVKKKILDYFINQNNYLISNECYWFLLENSSDYYQIFENEIEKIFQYGNNKITLSEMRHLLSKENPEEIDSLFFLILSKPADIIYQTQKIIISSTDSLLLLQRVKFFLDIIYSSNNNDIAMTVFPKYMFRNKLVFLEILKKTNPQKIINVLGLIKKTELLLKKQNNMYLPISQRFLINVRKAIF